VERPPAGRAQTLEAGELGLDRDAGGAGRGDQLAAVRGDRLGGGAGRVRGIADDAGIEGGWIGVETETDLAAALRSECRQPVGERLVRCRATLPRLSRP
jgi:hypothetical protein